MKLFLSSQGVPKALFSEFLILFGKPVSEITLAFIPNAAEVYSEAEKEVWYSEGCNSVLAMGISLLELDLHAFDGNPQDLRNELLNYDGVWVSGGNVFHLRYWMKRSGFDGIIRELVENGFVYCGYSAGSMVVGANLRFFSDVDPEPPFPPEIITSGIGLVDVSIIPHWDNGDPERARLDKVILSHYHEAGLPIITLTDGEVLVSNDNGLRKVTIPAQRIRSFIEGGKALAVTYIGTQEIKEGVRCDTYSFDADASRDLAIVTVKGECATPLQKVVDGSKTIEGIMSGSGTLSIGDRNNETKIHYLEAGDANKRVEVDVGQTMQWKAGLHSDLMFYEICEPPYKEGRFENLSE